MPNLNIEDNTAVPGYINSFMITACCAPAATS